MQAFVDACRDQPSFVRLRRVLRAITVDPGLHCRFLNSLARLEYVGVRKMLKARRAEDIDLDGLRHVLEEAVHATRLKKSARAVAPPGVSVDTFRPEHTLAGEAAEGYFQRVDAAAAAALGRADGEACYVLTSAAIEIRARCLYPAYQQILEELGSPVSVASILADEDQHLEHMASRLPARVPDWRERLQQVMQDESRAFEGLLGALEAAVGGAESRAAEAAAREVR